MRRTVNRRGRASPRLLPQSVIKRLAGAEREASSRRRRLSARRPAPYFSATTSPPISTSEQTAGIA